jgi:Zn-dependent protease
VRVFGGGPTIQLARLFGIRIGASPSWFFVLFVFIYILSGYFQDVLGGSSTEGYVVAVIAAVLFFGSLVLHELGHALTARRLGISISGIDLWFFGGVARMSRDTETPGDEFKVAAAGPAVTAVIVAVCLGVGAALSSDALDVARVDGDANASAVVALLGFLGFINIVLLVFNLVPAFPLDGGRIARAIVWRVTGDRNRATRVAGRMGQVFAYVVIGYGVYLASTGNTIDGLYAGVLGWFLLQAARGAVVSTAFTERLEGITVADIMDTEPVAMPADLPLTRAQDEFFLRYRWDWFPVVDEHGRFVGIAREPRVEEEIAAGRPALEVREVLDQAEAGAASVPSDRPLEALFADPQLRERGALMAVDGEGVLRGVVTVEQVRRALAAALPSRLA